MDEPVTPEVLARELEVIEDDLQSIKLALMRNRKATAHIANGLKLLCKQEQERFGCD